MIRVFWDDHSMTDYETLNEVKEDVLENFAASGVLADKVCEVDTNGNELKVFGLTWNVEISELPFEPITEDSPVMLLDAPSDICPKCKSGNITNEQPPEDGLLHVTCLDCGQHWAEPDVEPATS